MNATENEAQRFWAACRDYKHPDPDTHAAGGAVLLHLALKAGSADIQLLASDALRLAGTMDVVAVPAHLTEAMPAVHPDRCPVCSAR